MKVAIVGYGRMGREIEKIVKDRGLEYITIDNFAPDADFKQLNGDSLKGIDVAIDFTVPDHVMDNIKLYIEQGVNVVMGTTGWYERMAEVEEAVGERIGFIWSGNYSIGVNIYYRVLKQAAKYFNQLPQYDPLMLELHHKEKIDSPSGTALMINDIVMGELERKNKPVTERLDRKIEPEEIHVASVRGGYIPGTHSVMFDSPVDTIEIKHTARNREGFASGVVFAAEWINEKKGFYSIDRFLDTIIEE